jgi:hypothetical protein
MSGVTQKNYKKIIYAPILILFGGNVVTCMMFACYFDKNLFALLLFEGICNSNRQNKSISLQQAKRVGTK